MIKYWWCLPKHNAEPPINSIPPNNASPSANFGPRAGIRSTSGAGTSRHQLPGAVSDKTGGHPSRWLPHGPLRWRSLTSSGRLWCGPWNSPCSRPVAEDTWRRSWRCCRCTGRGEARPAGSAATRRPKITVACAYRTVHEGVAYARAHSCFFGAWSRLPHGSTTTEIRDTP